MIRVLVIDDNETDRLLVRRELGRVFDECEITEVKDEPEWQPVLEDMSFDVAITDYQLQWTDGLQTLKALKARYPDLPVIMFTGSGNEEIAVAAMKAGLDDY